MPMVCPVFSFFSLACSVIFRIYILRISVKILFCLAVPIIFPFFYLVTIRRRNVLIWKYRNEGSCTPPHSCFGWNELVLLYVYWCKHCKIVYNLTSNTTTPLKSFVRLTVRNFNVAIRQIVACFSNHALSCWNAFIEGMIICLAIRTFAFAAKGTASHTV
jgi:hypothetical protein